MVEKIVLISYGSKLNYNYHYTYIIPASIYNYNYKYTSGWPKVDLRSIQGRPKVDIDRPKTNLRSTLGRPGRLKVRPRVNLALDRDCSGSSFGGIYVFGNQDRFSNSTGARTYRLMSHSYFLVFLLSVLYVKVENGRIVENVVLISYGSKLNFCENGRKSRSDKLRE